MEQETQSFEVIVGTDMMYSKHHAIAQAAQMLSDIHEFRNGDIFDVNTYGGDDEQTIAVGLCFDTDIIVGDDYGLRNFMNRCTEHYAVESVERVSFQQVA